MVFTSKTLIPGKEPIGRNKDGSYIYDGVQTQNMSVMPSRGTYDTTKQMSVAPTPIYTPPTPLPMMKSPLGFNVMPQVNKDVAQKMQAPINDVLGLASVDKTTPHYLKIKEHVSRLQQKGRIDLTDEQSAYIKRFKAKYPDYANIPDVNLYVKNIQADPKIFEKYGNVGEKSLLGRIAGLPLAMAKTGSDAIMEAQDVFQERQKTLNTGGNLGLTNLLASASAGRALGTGVLGMAGDVLNVASPLINPETGVTSMTEGLTRDLGTMIEKVPEEYRQEISELMTRYPKITATLGTTFDLSNLIPFLGALGKAKNASQVDDILKTVKARPATRFRGEVSPTVFDAGMNRSLISDVAQIPVKTTKATLKGTAKAGEFTGETAIATGVGISKPSQQAIKETPELYRQARTGALTRETATDEVVSTLKKRLGELSDTGKEYNTIRQSPVTMPKQDFGKILDDFFKENDISKIDMPVKDRKVVQQAIDYIAEYDDILSAKNGLSLRRKLDDLADWSTDATGEGKRLIRKLRGKVDEYLGNKIPGLKDLDAKYAPEVSFLRKVKGGILNADGSIKDSAISYVANIVGKGKEMKLDRLEELLPGIGQKVRALKAFEEVQAISSMKTGSIMRQLSGVALGNTVVPGFGAIAGFIATNPNIVAFALEKYGMAKKAIQTLLKKGAKITPDEAIKVKQAVDAVPSKEVSTFLLGAGEQRKLLMPPKQGDNIIKQLGGGDTPTPSSSLPSQTSEVSSIQKLLQEPQKPQKTPGKSSVLNQLSKGKEKSAGKKVNNPIIQKLAKKQETPKTSKSDYLSTTEAKMTDTELKSLAKKYLESSKLPVGKGRVSSDNMADYKGYARIRDYFKAQGDDSLLETKLTPKTPEDWTKKDFTKATETKSVDKFGNTVMQDSKANRSIQVNGKNYKELDLPESTRMLYTSDGKFYEYKNGKMIPEGAKTPQVEGKTLAEEAKKYSSFKDFVQNVDELPTSMLRNENNLSQKVGKGVYNKNRTRDNLTNYGEDTPLGTFDNFVKDIKENGIQEPIRVEIADDGKIIIADGTHRLLAAEEAGIKNVPVVIVGKTGKFKQLSDIYKQAKVKPPLPLSSKSGVKYSKKDIAQGKYNPTEIYKDYTENYMHKEEWKGKSKAIVIDSDSIKEMFSEYNPKKPEIVHEESSKLSKEFFNRAVAENPDREVVFSAGGPASGKSEGIINGYHDNKVIIFDTVLADFGSFLKKAKSKIENGKVKVHAIYTDIDTARIYNKKRKRSVSEKLLLEKHKGFRQAMDDLLNSKEYKDGKIAVELKTHNGRDTKTVPSHKIEEFIRNNKNGLDIR